MNATPLNRRQRILVVADDPLARTGLATLLTEQSDYSIVGQIAASADLVANLGVYAPDLIVWDMGWEPTAAIERLADLGDAAVPVLALLADSAHAAVWPTPQPIRNLPCRRAQRVLPGVPTSDRALLLSRASPRTRACGQPRVRCRGLLR